MPGFNQNGPVNPVYIWDLNNQAAGNVSITGPSATPTAAQTALVVSVSPNSAPMRLAGPVTIDTTTPLAVYSAQAPTPPTYSAAGTVAPASAPTDVLTLTGSASCSVKVTAIGVSITSTAGVGTQIQLLKRTGGNTGGTATALAAVAHDSLNPAATATAQAYTANPTALGTLAGALRADKYAALAVASATPLYTQEWGYRPAQPLVLRGVAESLCVNLGGVTIAGGSMSFWIEWTES